MGRRLMAWPILAVVGALLALGAVAWLASDLPEAPPDPGVDVNAGGQTKPLPVVYGLRKTPGIRVFAAVGGPDRKYLWMAFALCEGAIEAVEQVWIDGEPITAIDHVFGSGHSAGTVGADKLAVVHWYRGTDTQTASALLTAAPGWTASHRLRGVAYLACRFRYSRDVFRGTPRVEALVRGCTLLDPRHAADAAAWSDNAALVVLDYCKNTRYGGGVPATEIDDGSFQAAAHDCDAAESYAGRRSLGSPSTAVSLGASRQRLTWLGAAPANLAGLAGASVYDASTGAATTKLARVLSVDRVELVTEQGGESDDEPGYRWRWAALATAVARTEILIERVHLSSGDLSPAFASTDTVYLAAAGRYEINAVIDTSRPVIDNLRLLLRGCRGMMPWIGGKYGLVIEQDRTPVLDIGPDEIIGGVDVSGPKARDNLNRATGKWISPERKWRPDSVIWPDPGSDTDQALLDADAGRRLDMDVDLPTVTSRAQAADLVRIAVLRTRGALRSRWRALPTCLIVTPGDVVRLTDATLGWVRKPQLVLGVAHAQSSELTFECVDHDAEIYDWADFDPASLHLDTDHPNPLIVSAPTALAVEVVLDRVRKDPGDNASPVIAVLIGAVVSWTAPADASAERVEIAYRSQADGASGWSLREAPAGAASVDLLPLRHHETYEFRARAINAYGAHSPWTDIVEKEIDKDITAPAAPTDLTIVGGAGLLAISWTPPTSIGFSHVSGELRRYAADGTVAETTTGVHYGDSITLSGLADDTKFEVRLRSLDDAGNESAWTDWVAARTADASAWAVVRAIASNTGGVLSSVAGTDDILLRMSDGTRATLDLSAPGEIFTADTYPSVMIGAEGSTFCLTQVFSAISTTKVIVEVYHKVAPSSWRRLGGHPAFATWHVGVGPPADFQFARGGDRDGVYWLESGAGRVWGRIDGVWHWITDISSGGRHQVYGGASAPPASVGDIGDRWLDISKSNGHKQLELYERGTAGWRKLNRLAGQLPDRNYDMPAAAYIRYRGSAGNVHNFEIVPSAGHPTTAHKWDVEWALLRSGQDFNSLSTTWGAWSGYASGYTADFSTTSLEFSIDKNLAVTNRGFFQIRVRGRYKPGVFGDKASANQYLRSWGTSFGAAQDSLLPPDTLPTGGTRPAPTGLSATVPTGAPRYVDIDWTEPGDAVDSDDNEITLAGYEGQIKESSESWDAQELLRAAADVRRPIRVGPGDYSATYDYRLRAVYSDHGVSAWASVSATTGDRRRAGEEIPETGTASYPPPTLFSATAVTGKPRYADIDWTPPAGTMRDKDNETVTLAAYEGQIRRVGDAWAVAETYHSGSGVSRPVRVGPGDYSTSYDYRLRAVYSDGGRSDWAEASLTTGDPPAAGLYPAPRQFAAGVSGLYAFLNWLPPSGGWSYGAGAGQGHPVALVAYEGEIKTSAEDWSDATTIQVSANIPRPVKAGPGEDGTTYDYRLLAIYEDGSRSAWVEASATL